MLKKYSATLTTQVKDPKLSPSNSTLASILNYSRSIEALKKGKDKILLNLN